jgi:hypothetical protein
MKQSRASRLTRPMLSLWGNSGLMVLILAIDALRYCATEEVPGCF